MRNFARNRTGLLAASGVAPVQARLIVAVRALLSVKSLLTVKVAVVTGPAATVCTMLPVLATKVPTIPL